MAKKQNYKCKGCGYVWTDEWVDGELRANFPDCPVAQDQRERKAWDHPQPYTVVKSYQFATTRPMREFTSVTGQPVNSMRQLKEQLKIASEDATVRTGTLHDFQPIDLRDRDALGVTDEGLDTTYERLHNEGRLKTKFIST